MGYSAGSSCDKSFRMHGTQTEAAHIGIKIGSGLMFDSGENTVQCLCADTSDKKSSETGMTAADVRSNHADSDRRKVYLIRAAAAK